MNGRRNFKTSSANRASALLMALILLAVLTVAGIAGVYYSRLNTGGSRGDRLSRIAYNLAEKGILKAQKKIYLKYKFHLADTSATPDVPFMLESEKETNSAGQAVESFHGDSAAPKRYFEFLETHDNRPYRIRYRIDYPTDASGKALWRCTDNPQLKITFCQIDYTLESALFDPLHEYESYLKSVYTVRRMNTASMGAFFQDDLELGDYGYDPLAATFKFKGMVHTNGHFFAAGHKDLFSLAGYLSAAKRAAAFSFADAYDPANLHPEEGVSISDLDGGHKKVFNYTNDSVEPLADTGVPGLTFSPGDLNRRERHDGQGYGDPALADTWTTDRNWQQNSLSRGVLDSRVRDNDTGVSSIDVPAGLTLQDGNAFETNAQVLLTLDAAPPTTSEQILHVQMKDGPGVTFTCPGNGPGICTMGGGAIHTKGNPAGANEIFKKTRIWNEREGMEIDLLDINMAKLVELDNALGSKYLIKGVNPDLTPIIYTKRADARPDCAVTCKYNPSQDGRCADLASNPQCHPNNAYQVPDSTRVPNGFRFTNTEEIPRPMMFASPQPLYLKGDVNLHQTGSGRYDPEISGYDKDNDRWQPLAIVADSVTLLSPQWDDNHVNNVMSWDSAEGKWKPPAAPNDAPIATFDPAHPWEVNATIVAGNTPSFAGQYNGGMENYLRLLEDFRKGAKAEDGRETLRITGNFFQLWRSRYGTGTWSAAHEYYNAPHRDWRYESVYGIDAGAHLPPGFKQLLGAIQPPPIVGSFVSQYIVAIGRADSTINREP